MLKAFNHLKQYVQIKILNTIKYKKQYNLYVSWIQNQLKLYQILQIYMNKGLRWKNDSIQQFIRFKVTNMNQSVKAAQIYRQQNLQNKKINELTKQLERYRQRLNKQKTNLYRQSKQTQRLISSNVQQMQYLDKQKQHFMQLIETNKQSNSNKIQPKNQITKEYQEKIEVIIIDIKNYQSGSTHMKQLITKQINIVNQSILDSQVRQNIKRKKQQLTERQAKQKEIHTKQQIIFQLIQKKKANIAQNQQISSIKISKIQQLKNEVLRIQKDENAQIMAKNQQLSRFNQNLINQFNQLINNKNQSQNDLIQSKIKHFIKSQKARKGFNQQLKIINNSQLIDKKSSIINSQCERSEYWRSKLQKLNIKYQPQKQITLQCQHHFLDNYVLTIESSIQSLKNQKLKLIEQKRQIQLEKKQKQLQKQQVNLNDQIQNLQQKMKKIQNQIQNFNK